MAQRSPTGPQAWDPSAIWDQRPPTQKPGGPGKVTILSPVGRKRGAPHKPEGPHVGFTWKGKELPQNICGLDAEM